MIAPLNHISARANATDRELTTTLQYRHVAPVPNAFVATFADEASVADIKSAAPIRYDLAPQPDDIHDAEDTASSPERRTELQAEATSEDVGELNADRSFSATAGTPTTSPRSDELEQCTFHLEVYNSNLQHDKYITSPHTNPLYGPFPPVSGSKSLLAGMLKDNVENSMWARGLRDWETDMERWRIAGADQEAGRAENDELKKKVLGKVSSWDEGVDGEGLSLDARTPTVARAIYTREVNRRRRAIPEIMWGLRRFKENAQNGTAARKGRRRREARDGPD